MSRAVVTPADVLLEAASLGVSILPGTSPGKLKLSGPAEAVKRLTPLVAQCKTELLEVLTERQAANDDRAATPARTCRDCQHMTAAGTCADPVRAGLRPHFGIVWPEPTRAGTCGAFTERQRPAPEPPREFCDHRDPATDAKIARMAARTEAFERMGLAPDEADLAVERLLRRDREGPRDMHVCVECAWLRAAADGWRCGALRGPIPREWVTIRLQRCPHFGGVDHD